MLIQALILASAFEVAPRPKLNIFGPALFHAAGQGADLWTTIEAKRLGAVEMNPRVGILGLGGTKLALGAAATGLDLGLQDLERKARAAGRRKTTVALVVLKWATRGGAAYYYGRTALGNLRVARELSGR